MESCNSYEVFSQNLKHLSPLFVKVLNEDFSSYLRISKENLGNAQQVFANRESISIVGPNGEFDISYKISREAVMLEKGWAKFSRAHHLCKSDRLTFCCVFSGHLIVFIYDKNGKYVGNSFRPGVPQPKREGRNNKEGQSKDKKAKVAASGSRLPGNRKDTSDDSSEEETDKLPTMEVRLRKAFCSHRRAVTNAEQSMALEEAKKFKSSRPNFLKQMKTNNVYKDFTFIVPIEFARANLPAQSTKISLRVPDRVQKWEVTCTFRVQNAGRQQVWTITGGWWRFSLDNNLEEGDALVFEMRKKYPLHGENRKTKMKVHIFRVVKKIKPLEVI